MARTSLGVIGCGTIAQIQQMPSLAELEEESEVSVVCDISAEAAEYVARRFHVPSHVTDYQRILDSVQDALLLCHADPKFGVAVATFDTGKHVFIEKPVCQSLEQANALIAAAGQAGSQGQVGYMKLFERALSRYSPDAPSTPFPYRFGVGTSELTWSSLPSLTASG